MNTRIVDFKNIDSELSAIRAKIEEIADREAFVESFEFKNDLSDEAVKNIKATHKYAGLYLFEIETNEESDHQKWFSEFISNWDTSRLYQKHVPTTKKSRIDAHKEIKKWMPLYIGKSKKIWDRLDNHIKFDIDKTTFAIKFRIRDEFKDVNFRFSTIRIDADNYDIVAPVFESFLRNKFNPLVGKQ